ncbi:MAG: hypothetical protein HY865_09045 [Chloroflexi bacterium]|nr:hypothetical protein [Chloroflexota bacterium]
MDEKEWKVYERLMKELSTEDLDDVLMFVKMRAFALKGKCKCPSNVEWMISKPWQKYWHYIRLRFLAGFTPKVAGFKRVICGAVNPRIS